MVDTLLALIESDTCIGQYQTPAGIRKPLEKLQMRLFHLDRYSPAALLAWTALVLGRQYGCRPRRRRRNVAGRTRVLALGDRDRGPGAVLLARGCAAPGPAAPLVAHIAAAQRHEHRAVQLAHLLGVDVHHGNQYDGAEFDDSDLRHVRIVGPAPRDSVGPPADGLRYFAGRRAVRGRARPSPFAHGDGAESRRSDHADSRCSSGVSTQFCSATGPPS